jgi:hypothetical protein
MQGAESNPGNFRNRDPKDVRAAAEKGGRIRGEHMHEEAEERHDQAA